MQEYVVLVDNQSMCYSILGNTNYHLGLQSFSGLAVMFIMLGRGYGPRILNMLTNFRNHHRFRFDCGKVSLPTNILASTDNLEKKL